MKTIRYVNGDASTPQGTPSTSKIIVHIVNDVGVWGSGFVIALSRKWPRTRGKYLDHYRRYGLSLGETQFCVVESSPEDGRLLVVASIVGQRGLISRSNPRPFSPEGFRRGLEEVAKLALKLGAEVHMPRVGTGRGGTTWGEVLPIVEETLLKNGVPVTVYDWDRS